MSLAISRRDTGLSQVDYGGNAETVPRVRNIGVRHIVNLAASIEPTPSDHAAVDCFVAAHVTEVVAALEWYMALVQF